jgi:hypothetical protein
MVAITTISLWEWNIGFSSAFMGISIIVTSILFTWGLLYQERVKPDVSTTKTAVSLPVIDPDRDGMRCSCTHFPREPAHDCCVCVCVCVCVAGGLNTSVIEYALHTHQTYNIHLVRAVCTMPIAVFAILIKLSPFEVSNATACNSMLACAAKKLYLSALTTLVCLAEAARHLIHRTHHVLCAHVLRTTVA